MKCYSDHRISAYNIPVDLMSKDAVKYLNDPRMTSFCIPYPDDDTQMQQTAAKLRAGGWFKKGYYYPIDEPFTQNSFAKFTEIINRLKRVVPDYHITTPFYRHPDYGNKTAFEQMTGSVNIWCPNSGFIDGEPKTDAFLAERRNAGERTWWYVCCGPGDPYNNYFISMSAMSHRLLLWQQKRLGIQGPALLEHHILGIVRRTVEQYDDRPGHQPQHIREMDHLCIRERKSASMDLYRL